jgi:hypothetical protein
MRKLFHCFLFCCFFLLSTLSPGQDSLHTTRYDSRFYLFDKTTKDDTQAQDSSFNQLSNYFPRNWLGNIGLPNYPYLLSFRDNDPLGIKWFSSPYDTRLLGLTNDSYFWQKGLHTNIFGAAGSKKEQVLKLSHIQNLNERLNFSLLLNRYSSAGFYQFQQSFVNNVLFSSNYEGKKKRFGYFFSYSFDRFKHQENGGITSDTSIVAEPLVRKDLLSVYLNNTARRNYSLMAGNFSLFFKLNRDSMAKVNHYILFGGRASINKSHYTDAATVHFYKNIYQDSINTNDTTIFTKYTPSLSYNFNTQHLNMEAGSRYDYSTWKERDSSTTQYTSLIAFEGVAWQNTQQNLVIKERASYVVSGNNNGDYEANLSAFYRLSSLGGITVGLKAGYENRSPDLFFRHYSSNNFLWNNSFDKTQTTKGEATVSLRKIRLELGAVYSTASKLILLDSNSLPTQFNGSVQAVRVFVRHHLKVYKFHLVNDINYQSKNSYALALPQLYTLHQLYFEHRVKKNGLKMQVGVQANYVSQMDILSYNPALNSFYLKYGKEPKGNYVFGDFFFSVYFKPVKFFFKAEHLNQGFTGINYTFVNGYYQPDRAFRFGVNWEFWD